jgi:putative NADPH-quinone reductase/1,4-dihydroxy-2-naphthoate octaprenyltransferase
VRCLFILAHPRRDSLCGALFDALVHGAREAGVEERSCVLGDMAFDPDVHTESPEHQPLEPELARAQRDIAWAEHIVFVYPTWWGTFPARLKGFLDRTLTPGFAFRHHTDGHWDRLLKGRTAELLTTMDTPPWVYRWIYRAPGHQALAAATLGYCGIETVRRTVHSPVVDSTAKERQRWIEQARARGRELGQGARSPAQRRRQRVGAWLAALRLQFYPMTWIAYTVGALAAASFTNAPLAWVPYLLGYGALFLLEAATVFLNDWFDIESDRRNTNSGPFSGGSRVLVDARLSTGAMRQGIGWALGGTALLLGALLATTALPQMGAVSLIYGVLALLALSYTVPPLKLSHRGLGELDVVLTHSAGVLLAGYVVQGGGLGDSLPWLLALPLGISILPSILLAGCPDRSADAAAGKRTLVVKLGHAATLRLATVATVLAPSVGLLLVMTHPGIAELLGWGVLGGSVHAAWLWRRLHRLSRHPMPGRIDSVIVLALSFMLWFCVPPLIVLVHGTPG